MYSVYLVDDVGEEYWVYAFPTHEEAEKFMKDNNTENFDYVIKEGVDA